MIDYGNVNSDFNTNNNNICAELGDNSGVDIFDLPLFFLGIQSLNGNRGMVNRMYDISFSSERR